CRESATYREAHHRGTSLDKQASSALRTLVPEELVTSIRVVRHIHIIRRKPRAKGLPLRISQTRHLTWSRDIDTLREPKRRELLGRARKKSRHARWGIRRSRFLNLLVSDVQQGIVSRAVLRWCRSRD